MQILSQIEQGDAGQPPKHLICDRDSIFDCSAFRRYLDLPIAARGSNRVPIGRVMEETGITSVAELVRLSERAELS